MSFTTRRLKRFLFLMGLLVSPAMLEAQTDPGLQGAWAAERYLMAEGGEHEVQGRIFFSERDWQVLFFVMDDHGEARRGSGEGGTYELTEGGLVFTHLFNLSVGDEMLGLPAAELQMISRPPRGRPSGAYGHKNPRGSSHPSLPERQSPDVPEAWMSGVFKVAAWSVVAFGLMCSPSAAFAQSDVAFPPEVYAARRARLVAQLDAPIIVPSEYMIRHGGEKKQEPNFFYLTGVESPYAVLYLEPDGNGGMHDVLFLPSHREFAGAQYSYQDPRLIDSAWNRLIRRLEPGPEAEAATGVAETHSLDEFANRLRDLTGAAATVYFAKEGGNLYAPPGLSAPQTLRQQLEASVSEALDGRSLADATPAIERMRVVKDAYEIDALRRAAQISAEGIIEAMRRIEPGMNDLEVAGIMEWAWKRGGSPRTAFTPIVASGPDAISLFTIRSENYNSVNREMQGGDLVFIDYGAAEWAMYGSDICRTFPVSGRFSAEQRRLYEIVLEAQRAAIAEVRPGASILDVIRAAARVYQEHGLEPNEDIDRMGADRVWGLMPSPTHYLTQGRGLTQYTAVAGLGVRDIGHHIGLEATDGRDYTTPLEPGMVFSVEPKLYAPELDIAIMIEDVILVTEDGFENLSVNAPRSVEEIERIMGER